MRFFRENLSYKILAFVLAVALWADVKLHQEPETIPVIVRLDLRGVPSDVVATSSVSQVTAVVSGPKVYVSRISSDLITAFVDLRGVAPGQRREEVKVSLPTRLKEVVSVMSVAPDKVDVRIRRKARKTVSVTVEWTGPPVAGARYGTAHIDPASVEAVGPDTAVDEVDHAVVSLRTGDPHITGHYVATPVDDRGDPVSEVSLVPDSVSVDATLTPTQGRQQAFVLPAYSGQPADGYTIDRVWTEPQVVTLLGEPDVVQNLTSVRTRPIDVSLTKSEFTRTVEVMTPHGVTAVPPTVQVRVRIVKAPQH